MLGITTKLLTKTKNRYIIETEKEGTVKRLAKSLIKITATLAEGGYFFIDSMRAINTIIKMIMYTYSIDCHLISYPYKYSPI